MIIQPNTPSKSCQITQYTFNDSSLATSKTNIRNVVILSASLKFLSTFKRIQQKIEKCLSKHRGDAKKTGFWNKTTQQKLMFSKERRLTPTSRVTAFSACNSYISDKARSRTNNHILLEHLGLESPSKSNKFFLFVRKNFSTVVLKGGRSLAARRKSL